MGLLAVTVLGHDRPGIIADVTAVLAELGGNLEDSSMTLLRGHFAWTLVVSVDVTPEDVAARLAFLSQQGLVVSVLPVVDEPAAEGEGRGYVVSVHGGDRPGIVSAVTRVLADHGGNVTDLTTRLRGGSLYVVVADVDLPAAADEDAVRADLAATARELGVDVTLRPVDTDVL